MRPSSFNLVAQFGFVEVRGGAFEKRILGLYSTEEILEQLIILFQQE